MAEMTESEMRDAKAPQCESLEALAAYIKTLVDRPHEYGTCVYAMSLASEAAFRFVAGRLGVTGFQASCADFDFLRRTRNLKGPFMLVDASKVLYPQYDILGDVRAFLDSSGEWAAAEARKLIEENKDRDHVHPGVAAHWKSLALTAKGPVSP